MNPYFQWEAPAPDAGWRPFTDLLSEDVVAERVDAARAALLAMFRLDEAAVPVRVVASVTFLGVAARLVSPPLAAALADNAVPQPAPEDLWWRPVPGGPWPMACGPVPVVRAAAPAAQGAALHQAIVLGLVAPLLEVFRARFRLSPQVLWGNVASALGGAAGQLDARAWPVVAAVLARPPLAGTAVLHGPDPAGISAQPPQTDPAVPRSAETAGISARPPLIRTTVPRSAETAIPHSAETAVPHGGETAGDRWVLMRRNCCLYYRIPGGGTCGDCVLRAPATRMSTRPA